MAMRIGGKAGQRPFLLPGNKGMAERAKLRVEHTAAALNAQLDEALKVDGVPIILWHQNDPGGRRCTCAPGGTTSASTPRLDGSPAVQRDNAQVQDASPRFRIAGLPGQVNTADLGALHDDTIPSLDSDDMWESDEIGDGGDLDSIDNLEGNVDQEGESVHYADELARAMPGVFGTSGVFSGSYISSEAASCPVCVGASYLESWQPHGGRRIVMGFAAADDYSTTGDLSQESHPNILTLDVGQYLEFSLKLPRLFTKVIRCGLWDGRRPLEGEAQVEILVGLDWVTCNQHQLEQLGGNGEGGIRQFRFLALQKTMVTHFDTVVMLTDLPLTQFPPLNAPYAFEFQEYMTSISIELPASLRVGPGDLLSDFKHRKMWRVTNAVPHFTAGGRALPTQVDLQVVTSTDRAFSLHPFQVPVEMGPRPFSGENERMQGGVNALLSDREV